METIQLLLHMTFSKQYIESLFSLNINNVCLGSGLLLRGYCTLHFS
jgi:hypothetical protein